MQKSNTPREKASKTNLKDFTNMFTGIIQETGTVQNIEGEGIKKITIRSTHKFLRRVKRGASIAIDGACMTLISRTWRTFTIEAMEETLQKTTFGTMQEGDLVNLERSYKVGDEVGGHIVSGHIEGMAEIVEVRKEGETTVMRFQAPETLVHPVQEKGFIALHGASLTVTNWNEETNQFDIYFIPATLEHTNFGILEVGDLVNIESWRPA